MEQCRNGYTYRNGKCSKRSNNPFRMWLAWVGAVIGLIIMGLWLASGGYEISLLYGCVPDGCSPIATLVYGILPATIGFLLGWVLTILYRRFVK